MSVIFAVIDRRESYGRHYLPGLNPDISGSKQPMILEVSSYWSITVVILSCLFVVDGGWCPFNWTGCSVSCGNGYIYGQRSCNCPAPSNGGQSCQGSSSAYRNCSRSACVQPSPSPMPSPTLPPSMYFILTHLSKWSRTFYLTISRLKMMN